MADSIGGALVAIVETLNWAEDKVFLDFAPERTLPPYVTYNDNVSYTPLLKGDSRTEFIGRDLQFNLWQHPNDEDPTRLTDLIGVLNGAVLKIADNAYSPLTNVLSCNRVPEPEDSGVIHHEITVGVAHPVQLI